MTIDADSAGAAGLKPRYYFDHRGWDSKKPGWFERSKLNCRRPPIESIKSSTVVRPTTANDDSNCLNSVHASASANTDTSYSLLSIAHLTVAAMRTRVKLKHRILSKRRM